MNKKSLATEFLENNIYRFIHTFVIYLGGLIFTIVTARLLGPEGLGTYTLALSFALILMTLGDLGINEAMIRYVSKNINNPKKAKSYFVYLFKIKLVILISLSFLLLIFSKVIVYFYHDENLFIPLIFASFYIFFYSFMQLSMNLFISFKNIKGTVFKEIVFQSFRVVLIPALVLLTLFKIAGPIIFEIIASIFGSIFAYFYLYKKYPLFFKEKSGPIDKKELFGFIKYLSIGSLTILFLLYTDILILGKFVELKYVGFYKTAASITMMLVSIMTLTSTLYPILSQLDKKRSEEIFKKIVYVLLMFSIPMSIGVIMVSRFVIRLLFGYDFLPSTIPLYGLSLLILIMPIEELFRILLNSKGESKITGKTIFYAGLINILLNFVFIYTFLFLFKDPIYATLGAAIATSISRGFVIITLFRHTKNKFKIKLNPSWILKPLFASFIMALFLIIFDKLTFGISNIWLVALEIILGALIYFITLFLIKGILRKDLIFFKETATDLFSRYNFSIKSNKH
ncbi:MAG: flippase [Candidatus Pacearchaeota archaeon]|jgi:O-antigen/teichoic acid export membrane protein